MKLAPLLLTYLIGLAVPMVGLAQPIITVQAQSQTNVAGTGASFTVVATGIEPLAYQWRFSTADLAGKTNDTLILTNVQTANAGSYAVVVTNADGAATSVVATLTVLVPPFMTKQPTNFPTLSLGASVGNRVTASGTTPLYYQWRLNGTNLPGATNPSLVITNLQLPNVGSYTAVATNSVGSVTSVGVTLSVDPTFTKITSGAIVTDRGDFPCSSWADYDNDGFLDLLVGHFATANFLYHNNRDGTFSRINTAPIATDPEHTIRCAWADYDNDGFLDFVAFNGSAQYLDSSYPGKENARHSLVFPA